MAEVDMTTAQIELPPKMIKIFTGDARYRVAYGGRGSGKTRSFALMTAVKAYQLAEGGKSGVILCAREYMNSLEESSLEEVKQAIISVGWLSDYFEIGEKYVRTKNRRVSYVFSGLRHNLDSIKSKARILLAWVDEAENVSDVAWMKLLPTVREEGSEIYVSYNPELDGSPTDKRFRKDPPTECRIEEVNYWDNPWFPDVLEQERQSDQQRLDPQTYAWVWEGAYLENSDKQVLAGKYEVAEFEPERTWDGPYFGLDWGFANDPTAGIKCWVHDECLYIEYEAGKVGLELDDTGPYMRAKIPGIEKYVVRADCARPESISYLKRDKQGLPAIQAAPKWSGSVEDGVQHLRSYRRIYIHPRCTETIREARMYSYKVDRLTGDIKPDIDDKFNHYIDALRYALAPLIQGRSGPAVLLKKRR
ncbi:PBSX family phage terminase large subunit [Herbaspirillum sp.]|uniref:PBSX family phage terminase large subunit n=1 Tax=Herbaspirillum sp. TaxID=1890675 RepID=UPI00257C0129|nr:PBSX family phage terminase large subunit [Herbaspirillum sp.]